MVGKTPEIVKEGYMTWIKEDKPLDGQISPVDRNRYIDLSNCGENIS